MKKILITIYTLSAFLFSAQVFADGLKCSLNYEGSDYPPHTKVESDINGDGVKDLFYLAGEEDVFQTCVFLGKKSKSKIDYDLVHSHSDFYDTIFDFDNSKTAEILVPSDVEVDCGQVEGDNAQYLIPDELKSEIKKSYEKWSKGYESYNFTYNMPDFFPIHNLFLLNEVKIYKLVGKSKVDVTKKMTSYLDLKKKVLNAALKQKSISKKCKSKLEKTLSGIK